MTPMSISRLTFSSEQGWPELLQRRPPLSRVFAFIVLPLALLPPLMLYFAGTHHPEVFPSQFAGRSWSTIAVLFFAAEMFTLLLMGWLIRQVAQTHQLRIDYHDAYLLAMIAPVPMWLSSLGLLVPSLAFNAVVSLAGLAMSCALVYHGIEGLSRTREGVTAAGIVQIVIGAGLVAWALLLVLVLA